jgi:hypothetical protein
MNWKSSLIRCAALVVVVPWLGCEKHDHAGHDEEDHAPFGPAAAGPAEETAEGMLVAEETRRAIGLAIGSPAERVAAPRLEISARVYAPGEATALVSPEEVTALQAGQQVEIVASSGLRLTGTLARVDRQLERATGQAEVLIEFTPKESLKAGEAIRVAFVAKERTGLAVPRGSVLRSGTGSFVFVSAGDRLRRKPVQTSMEENGWVQIIDGVHANDRIVTNGVQGLWCLELQATKAGTACCPAPARK